MDIRKIFTFFVVVFPPLTLYGIGISSVTLADACLMFSLLLLPFAKGNKGINAVAVPILLFMVYVVLNYMICIADYKQKAMDVTMVTLRYLFYLFTLTFCVKKYFLPQFGVQVYKYVTYFSVLYITIQSIAVYLWHIYIPGYVSFLPVMRDELIEHAEHAIEYLKYVDIRPRSIFAEPAHYAQYVLGYIALLFSSNPQPKRFMTQALVLSFGIILSGSSTGILCLGALWILYMIRGKNSAKYIPIVLVALLVIFQLKLLSVFESRMEDGASTAGRFDGYFLMWKLVKDNLLSLFVGHGMRSLALETGIYLPGYPRLVWYFGLIGMALFLVVMLSYLKRHRYHSNALIILFLALNLGTEVALGPFMLLYTAFIIVLSNENRNSNFKLQRL